jgi:hypothetical protein
VSLRIAWVVCFFVLTGCSGGPEDPPCRVRPDGRSACGPSRVSLPVTASRGLVVEGTIDGRPAHLLIDTGTDKTVVSSTFLGITDQTGVLANLCIGELCFSKEPAWAWDTPFSGADPGGINAFVGMSTLAELIVGIDHGDYVILDSLGTPCSGVASPLSFTDPGTPLANVRVGSQAEQMLTVDSGSLFTVLSATTAAALATELADVAPASLCTVQGCDSTLASTAQLGSYCVFETCLKSVPVKFPIWDAVGYSYLSAFRIDLDFPRKRFVYCD